MCAAILLLPLAAQEESPAVPVEVKIKKDKGKKFNRQEMSEIYHAACLQAAMELWPNLSKAEQAAKLRPVLVLEIGGDNNRVFINSSLRHSVIELDGWDRQHMEWFAQGVIYAALAQVLTAEKFVFLARMAMQASDATISVQELKKE